MKYTREHFCQLSATYFKERGIGNSLWGLCKKTVGNLSSVSSHHPLTATMFRSTKTISDEKERHTHSAYWYIIHPFSLWSYYWSIVMAFIYVLTVTIDMFHMATTIKIHVCVNKWYLFGIVILVNLIYLFHIFIQFITGFITTDTIETFSFGGIIYQIEKRVEFEPRLIAWHYLKGFFIVDIITLLNVAYYIACPFLTFSTDIADYVIFFLRLIRLLRFYTMFKTAKLVIGSITNDTHIYKFFVIVFIHVFGTFFFGCMYIILPDIYKNKSTFLYREYIIRIGRYPSQLDMCMHAFYYAFGIMHSTESYMDIKIFYLKIVYIINSIFGICLQGFFLFILFNYLYTKYKSNLKFEDFLSKTRYMMLTKKIEPDTQVEIIKYIQNTLKEELFNVEQISSTLSPRLRYEIFVKSSMDLVRKCHLFTNLPQDVTSSLALRLKLETYTPGTYVVRIGEVATCMYFIAVGTVAVYNKYGNEMCHLGDGEYFGEIGLISLASPKRNADVLTIENSELYRLDIKDFQGVITPTSRMYQRMRQESVRRISSRRRDTVYDSDMD